MPGIRAQAVAGILECFYESVTCDKKLFKVRGIHYQTSIPNAFKGCLLFNGM